MTAEDINPTPFTEREIERASENYNHQVSLMEVIAEAYAETGLTYAEFAKKFEATEEYITEILTLVRAPNLTELRYLANELGLVINYTVEVR
jgi:cyanate lyase